MVYWSSLALLPQVFSVLFLVRNALVVLCQLLSNESAKVVLLNLMLYISLSLGPISSQSEVFPCLDS